MTPGEIKFRLDAKLLELAREGHVPQVVGLHSCALEGNTVHVGYDVLIDQEQDVLFFEFERPALVARDEIREFSLWLATDYVGMTVH